MASPTQRTWVWVNSASWWTGRPGVLQSMGSQIVGLNWVTELELNWANSRWDQWSRFQFALSLWSHLQMRMVTGVKVTSLHHLLTTFIYLKSALVTVPILSPFVRLISEPYFNLSVRTLPARVLGEQDAGREVLGGGLFWALRLPAVRPAKLGATGSLGRSITCSHAPWHSHEFLFGHWPCHASGFTYISGQWEWSSIKRDGGHTVVHSVLLKAQWCLRKNTFYKSLGLFNE